MDIADKLESIAIDLNAFSRRQALMQGAREIRSLRQQLAEQTSGYVIEVKTQLNDLYECLTENDIGTAKTITRHIIAKYTTPPSVEVLLEALRKIASFTQDSDLLWWQKLARDALNAYSSKPQNLVSVHTDSDSN
jgi:hypothetical protein